MDFAGCHQACFSQPIPLQQDLQDKSKWDGCPWPTEGFLHVPVLSLADQESEEFWGGEQGRRMGRDAPLSIPFWEMPHQPAGLGHLTAERLLCHAVQVFSHPPDPPFTESEMVSTSTEKVNLCVLLSGGLPLDRHLPSWSHTPSAPQHRRKHHRGAL